MKAIIFVFFISLVFHINCRESERIYNYNEEGYASYYSDYFEGRKTANGEIYDHNKLTAAHKTLPFGTEVLVENLNNNKSVIVVINDRGPFHKKRIIDLSLSAADSLGILHKGVGKVFIKADTLSISQ